MEGLLAKYTYLAGRGTWGKIKVLFYIFTPKSFLAQYIPLELKGEFKLISILGPIYIFHL